MPGLRLPSGELRKASQKRSRKAGVPAATVAAPTFNPGDPVRWSRHTGTVRRVVGDKADVVENVRKSVWRVSVTELTRVVRRRLKAIAQRSVERLLREPIAAFRSG